ncbi:MAG: hypothetical protein A2381_02785 [Bdellovibrionales bacterium RIFOXYB1_FULL_37_110]|nr:MAG: hypothetical protein A2181_03165 [Bdellovibrionales bacterium RIFOXYA1_FULL_38_20]OFZ51431.1 MAG: hypothetical protein A2417_09240 [Bdellovibrionales bacterium RIFOXYC1_FULL_37_79]OFZ57859.1 MAG: hypothetical protein A2381_02785 [Bdellovibrionales bacterium RIFOXYB1_FULL_37_110]OFZ63585.1 MAG: hypothetical protein A2577_05085 [Bdellovibrionales bacterium RIFOXYD1_FULL_36_51]
MQKKWSTLCLIISSTLSSLAMAVTLEDFAGSYKAEGSNTAETCPQAVTILVGHGPYAENIIYLGFVSTDVNGNPSISYTQFQLGENHTDEFQINTEIVDNQIIEKTFRQNEIIATRTLVLADDAQTRLVYSKISPVVSFTCSFLKI